MSSGYEIDMSKLGAASGSDLHEAKEIKIHELIEKGEEHRVQWGELLKTFSGLDPRRIQKAIEHLNPSQIASIREGIENAFTISEQRALESGRAHLSKLGISPEHFIRYLSGDSTPRLPNSEGRRPRTRYSNEAKVYAEKLLTENPNLKVSQLQEKVFIEHKERLAHSTIYAIKARVKKKSQ